MTRTLLVYPPFCTPASPPYSITRIYAFLRDNLPGEHELGILDLNILFHREKFPEYYDYCRSLKNGYRRNEYESRTKDYRNVTELVYAHNNRKVVEGGNPELFDALLKAITDKKPDIVAFSIVYSSQAFYAFALIKALKALGIRTVIGGPAVNTTLKTAADQHLKNELELMNYILGEETDHNSLRCDTIIDFSIYDLEDYFTPEPVIPMRTTTACYYRKCAFCTHYGCATYLEYDLHDIERSIIASKAKHVFFVDDIIHKKRLLEIAAIMKPLDMSWMCQLKPTADLDLSTLRTLRESGLKVIIWGVESASDRILTLMRKGTKIREVKQVLQDSHDAGMMNCVYIMFGFPTETDQEFIMTIDFLKANSAIIDLVSTSIFGLQKGSFVYENPKFFGVTEVKEEKRTILEPKISYQVSHGLTPQQAREMRRNYKNTLDNLSKYPRSMNFFREHLLCLS